MPAWNLEITGTYAQTEMGHGTVYLVYLLQACLGGARGGDFLMVSELVSVCHPFASVSLFPYSEESKCVFYTASLVLDSIYRFLTGGSVASS